jgi:hypothetical protein
MSMRQNLFTCLAALGLLAFTAGCGSGQAAPPTPPSHEKPRTGPPVTPATSFVDYARGLILSMTDESAEPLALPDEELADSEAAEPFYDEAFFREAPPGSTGAGSAAGTGYSAPNAAAARCASASLSGVGWGCRTQSSVFSFRSAWRLAPGAGVSPWAVPARAASTLSYSHTV